MLVPVVAVSAVRSVAAAAIRAGTTTFARWTATPTHSSLPFETSAPRDLPVIDTRYSDPNALETPWPDVERVLDEAELFWISSVRATGTPHVTPLPAVWRDSALHFSTGAEEQKG